MRELQPAVTVLRFLAVGSVCAVVTLAGCFKLARPTPPLEEYILSGATSGAPATSTRNAAAVTVGLRRLDLAPYLATTAIIVRHGSQVSSTGFRRWAEEPAAGISRAVAAYLGATPSIRAVDVAPWAVTTPHDYLVQLHVANLEGIAADDAAGTSGEVHLLASWEIIRAADGALLARGRTERREGGWTVGDYRGLVSRLELGLNGVAGDLATCMARLSPLLPPPAATEVAAIVECSR